MSAYMPFSCFPTLFFSLLISLKQKNELYSRFTSNRGGRFQNKTAPGGRFVTDTEFSPHFPMPPQTKFRSESGRPHGPAAVHILKSQRKRGPVKHQASAKQDI